jgi:hypothetical protein
MKVYIFSHKALALGAWDFLAISAMQAGKNGTHFFTYLWIKRRQINADGDRHLGLFR